MNAVKDIRAALGVTQAVLAEGIGCTQGNIGHYEGGQAIPPANARRLIEFAKKRGLHIGFDHVYGAAKLPRVVPAKA